MALKWDDFESLVLQWVFEHTGESCPPLPRHSDEPFEDIPSLTAPQVADAIERLLRFGLITHRGNPRTSDSLQWFGLRPTADGLRLLGQWPPDERASMNATIAYVLRHLADVEMVALAEPERDATRRAAATVMGISGDVLTDVLSSEVSRLAGGGA